MKTGTYAAHFYLTRSTVSSSNRGFQEVSLYRVKLGAAIICLFAFAALGGDALGCSITVASDGSGDVKTVGIAVDKVPAGNKARCIVKIKPGRYDEQIRIPANKPYISFIGEDASKTILTYKISNKEAGSTSAAYATYIGGHDFHAENITFENSFGKGSQAVAVLVEADRAVFKNCRFLGWQDTLYAKNGRQYYLDSYIEGHVDYIFGQAAAVFENCRIHSKADGYIAAPMRFAATEPSGFIFLNSTLTSENTEKGVYLGRPWRDYGRTVFINTKMDAEVRPEGWHHWLPEREKTAYFAEYGSTGKGASPNTRVAWAKKLGDADVKVFSIEYFLGGKDGWVPQNASHAWLEKTKPDGKLVTWAEVFRQSPEWYQTDEAARIGDQVVLYQKVNGGFEKNVDMALMLTQAEKQKLIATHGDVSDTTIDNRTTYPQVAYLGRLISASMKKSSPPNNFTKYKEAFFKGLDYLLESQYANGGWPQFYPLKKGYYSHITFNDDATIGVLRVLRDIAKKKDDYLFVDEARRAKAEKAVERAIPMILKTQVVVNGKKTVWAAQYDENTLKPAPARAFEPVSLTAGESVGIARFLMLDSTPSPEVIDAIDSAVNWFKANSINGIRWERKNGEHVVTLHKTAPPIWARFYQIETMRPIFIGRDAVIKYDVMQIEAERRNGYAWYVESPAELLADHPQWKDKIARK
ncbi:MAG: pectate lyase [bacterium]|nr:pectate lyase [bacterium]